MILDNKPCRLGERHSAGMYAYLLSPVGREAGYRHPSVLVTAQRLDGVPTVVHVVPLTSTLRGFASEIEIEADSFNGLHHRSSAQCLHLRAVATARLADTRGNVGASALAQIREMLGLILDIAG